LLGLAQHAGTGDLLQPRIAPARRSSPVISWNTLAASSGNSRSQASKRKWSARAVLAVFLSVTSRR
jgi:hypothetical protein